MVDGWGWNWLRDDRHFCHALLLMRYGVLHSDVRHDCSAGVGTNVTGAAVEGLDEPMGGPADHDDPVVEARATQSAVRQLDLARREEEILRALSGVAVQECEGLLVEAVDVLVD